MLRRVLFIVSVLGRNDFEHDATHPWWRWGAVFDGHLGFRVFVLLRGEEALHIIQGLAQAWEGFNGSDGFASPN